MFLHSCTAAVGPTHTHTHIIYRHVWLFANKRLVSTKRSGTMNAHCAENVNRPEQGQLLVHRAWFPEENVIQTATLARTHMLTNLYNYI